MMAFGRFGGIAFFLVAELARRKIGFEGVFLTMAVPALIAAAALFVKQWVHPERKADRVSFEDVTGH